MAERTWDKFEAALLIDTYNSVDVGDFKRNIAVSKLSNNLRKRAVNLGLSIDSKYRNANGISMMLSTLVYLFSDGTKQPFKMPNNMFQEVYKIYRDNPKEFATLLAEAKKQCSDEFDLSTLSMENYISLIQKKTITGLNFEIVNKIELLKVRFIEHCNQAKRKGSLVWVENSDLIVWIKMLDSRLINISIINDSIFDSKDFYKFFRYQKSNELEDVLRTLVGKYNYTKFAEYLNFYIEYVNSLSDQDKVYLGFTSVFEENVVEREKLDKITAHSEITKENIDYEAKSGSGLFSNNNEIVSAGKDKPVLEATQNGVTRTAISDGSEEKHEQVGQKDETIVANHENESEYDDASDINEERFAAWLAQNAPFNTLGELYTY